VFGRCHLGTTVQHLFGHSLKAINCCKHQRSEDHRGLRLPHRHHGPATVCP
jgi:hypothetical protein